MERVRSGLRKIMADTLRHGPSEDAPLLAWPLVCGPAVAAKTRALEFRAGVLRVEAQDETWRKQLMEFASSYVAALNQMVSERVERVEFSTPGTRRPQ